MLTEIPATDIDAERFHDEIVTASPPGVSRGPGKDWPGLRAGPAGPDAAAAPRARLGSAPPGWTRAPSPGRQWALKT